jgi:hypothetical protein
MSDNKGECCNIKKLTVHVIICHGLAAEETDVLIVSLMKPSRTKNCVEEARCGERR